MSKHERYKLGDLTPSKHLGYLGNQRLDNLILLTSLLTLGAVATGLLGLVNSVLWLAGIAAVVAGAATFFMVRFTHQEQEQQRKWVLDTYNLDLAPGELQQLREGRSIQRGNVWWVRDQAPWIIGFKLEQTQAVNHG